MVTVYEATARTNKRIADKKIKKNPLPGQVLGASTTAEITPPGLTDAQLYGAGGFGANTLNEKQQQSVSTALQKGVPTSELGKYDRNPRGYNVPVVDKKKSAEIASTYGLKGIKGAQFEGMTDAQAFQKARQMREQYMKETSSLTSAVFNPETINGAKKAMERLSLSLNDISNDPFSDKGTKMERKKSTLESTAAEIAKYFTDPRNLTDGYTTNPELKLTLDRFLASGGSMSQIAGRIKPVTKDATAPAVQDTASYLASLNSQDHGGENLDTLGSPNASESAQNALNDLIPEKDVAQQEIARIAGIAEEYKSLYFGTPEEMGVLEQKRINAEERKKLVESNMRKEKAEARARAQYEIDMADADLEIAKSRIEENRLQSKNYLTGMLAKLGALNTTGAAVQAVTVVDQKYKMQAVQMETQHRLKSRAVQLELTDRVNEIESKAADDIITIQEDMTKTQEDVVKEIFKIKNQSAKEIYGITAGYATKLRTLTNTYEREAKAEARRYAKEYAKAASGIDLDALTRAMEGDYVHKKGILRPDGSFKKMRLTPTQSQEVENALISGEDTIKYFINLPPAFRDHWQTLTAEESLDTRFSIRDVQAAYEQWKKDKSTKTTITTTKNAKGTSTTQYTSTTLPGGQVSDVAASDEEDFFPVTN